jgi:hypothetical protein
MSTPVDASDWLPAWMGQQIEAGTAQRASLPPVTTDAMYVHATLGIEAALASTGEVYVGEYDLETFASATESITWRRAERVERLGYLVIAARRFAELSDLLPRRSADATGCASCRSTGDWHVFSGDRKESLRIRGMICKDCGGLGWRAAGADGPARRP